MKKTVDIAQFEKEIKAAAIDVGLEPSLIAAILIQESAGNQFAFRFEPGWRYFCTPETFAKKCKTSVETEKQAQAFSYGLMQIMGAVAREHGFNDPMPLLFQVDVNLHYGCKHLKKFVGKYRKFGLEHAIASYNAGSPRLTDEGNFVNQDYVDNVLRLKKDMEALDAPGQ